jgi:hypothetical protein
MNCIDRIQIIINCMISSLMRPEQQHICIQTNGSTTIMHLICSLFLFFIHTGFSLCLNKQTKRSKTQTERHQNMIWFKTTGFMWIRIRTVGGGLRRAGSASALAWGRRAWSRHRQAGGAARKSHEASGSARPIQLPILATAREISKGTFVFFFLVPKLKLEKLKEKVKELRWHEK